MDFESESVAATARRDGQRERWVRCDFGGTGPGYRRGAHPHVHPNAVTMTGYGRRWQEETPTGRGLDICLRARDGLLSYAAFRFPRPTWLLAECEDGWAGRRQDRVPPF